MKRAFDLLLAPWDAKRLRVAIDSAIDALIPDGIMPTWTNNNHDAHRAVTRYGREDAETYFSGNNLINSTAPVDFEVGQALRQAAADGVDETTGAMRWQRRGHLDDDVPKHIQAHGEQLSIA